MTRPTHDHRYFRHHDGTIIDLWGVAAIGPIPGHRVESNYDAQLTLTSGAKLNVHNVVRHEIVLAWKQALKALDGKADA